MTGRFRFLHASQRVMDVVVGLGIIYSIFWTSGTLRPYQVRVVLPDGQTIAPSNVSRIDPVLSMAALDGISDDTYWVGLSSGVPTLSSSRRGIGAVRRATAGPESAVAVRRQPGTDHIFQGYCESNVEYPAIWGLEAFGLAGGRMDVTGTYVSALSDTQLVSLGMVGCEGRWNLMEDGALLWAQGDRLWVLDGGEPRELAKGLPEQDSWPLPGRGDDVYLVGQKQVVKLVDNALRVMVEADRIVDAAVAPNGELFVAVLNDGVETVGRVVDRNLVPFMARVANGTVSTIAFGNQGSFHAAYGARGGYLIPDFWWLLSFPAVGESLQELAP